MPTHSHPPSALPVTRVVAGEQPAPQLYRFLGGRGCEAVNADSFKTERDGLSGTRERTLKAFRMRKNRLGVVAWCDIPASACGGVAVCNSARLGHSAAVLSHQPTPSTMTSPSARCCWPDLCVLHLFSSQNSTAPLTEAAVPQLHGHVLYALLIPWHEHPHCSHRGGAVGGRVPPGYVLHLFSIQNDTATGYRLA